MNHALVVTSINAPNKALVEMAEGAHKNAWDFIVTGDAKTPSFELAGCRFLSLAKQKINGTQLGVLSPENSYARKNLGYLEAMRGGADVIVETDDDNHPKAGFWDRRDQTHFCRHLDEPGWSNVYALFSENFIYPRGLPLSLARRPVYSGQYELWADCPIQQGLADGDPDVDAVYRMLFPSAFKFDEFTQPVFMEEGTWCPFNSQNTTWFREAFPLMYIPSYCSFRMCDIWRSFVAQRIMPGIMFHGATVFQKRNEHDLHKDFLDEIPGYTHNDSIRTALLGLNFPDTWDITDKLLLCYAKLVDMKLVKPQEMDLLQAWIADVKSVTA